jgi:short-subunit dehydrogenase
MQFRNRTVFITGASSGIGAALARQLAAQGAELILAARREDKLHEVVASLPQPHPMARIHSCDVTRDGDLEAVVEQVKREGGKIDIVIANAGFGVAGDLQTLALEDYRRQFETNVFGVLRTIYATLAELKRTRGQLVIIGSVAGYAPQPGASAYGMSKFAVRALAESLHVELAREGVAVTLISPGFVDSEIRRTDNRGVVHEHARDPVPAWLRVRADRAAREIVRAIHRRKREQVVTGHGKLLVFLYRHTPWLIRSFQRLGIKGRPEPR